MIIHGKYLKALALLAPKKEPRSYLIGVHVEVKGSQAILVATDGAVKGSQAILVATTGTILGALRLTLTEEVESHAFTIPLSLLAMITAKDEVTVTYTKEEQGPGTVTLIQGDRVLSGKAVEGTYPPFRRVIPEKVSGVQDQLIAVRYLETVAKVCSMVNGVPTLAVHIHYNGADACIVDTQNEDFVLVVMPMRKTSEQIKNTYTRPTWLS